MGCGCKQRVAKVTERPATEEEIKMVDEFIQTSGSTNNTEENLSNDGQIGETQT